MNSHDDSQLDSDAPDGDIAVGSRATGEYDDRQLVPGWLAVLVVVLLLAVMGVGGYLVRGLVTTPRYETPEEAEISKWQEAVDSDPSSEEARLSLGFAYQQAERYDDAIAEYDRVLSSEPSDTAALYNKGMSLMVLGRDAEAEEVLWKVMEVDDTHVLAAKGLGEYYAEKGQYRSLIRAVRPAVQVTESAADLQYLMGLAYEKLGRADWSEARYRLALRYYPDMPEAREGLARLGVKP
ncbi:MAG: tetratricopeptide repeat protein [Coriobacteriia bacterium]|nr:tetratricopeptide repeat protein [Coriobacteriia bacterium]